MGSSTHIRHFVVPTVQELGFSSGGRDVPPQARVVRPTQRPLVAASPLHRSRRG